MRVAFYVLYGFFGLLGAYFVLTSLLGRYSLAGAPPVVARLVLLAGALAGGALLHWAYRLGEVQGRWGAGAGAVLLAVVAFQAVQLLGALGWNVARRWTGSG